MSTVRGGIAPGHPAQAPPQAAPQRDHLRRLKLASLMEGSTLALLVFVAVPLKHLCGWPAAVAVLGSVHGLAFLFYMLSVIEAVAAGEWTRGEAVRLLLTAFIPFGGFANLPFLSRRAAGCA